MFNSARSELFVRNVKFHSCKFRERIMKLMPSPRRCPNFWLVSDGTRCSLSRVISAKVETIGLDRPRWMDMARDGWLPWSEMVRVDGESPLSLWIVDKQYIHVLAVEVRGGRPRRYLCWDGVFDADVGNGGLMARWNGKKESVRELEGLLMDFEWGRWMGVRKRGTRVWSLDIFESRRRKCKNNW